MNFRGTFLFLMALSLGLSVLHTAQAATLSSRLQATMEEAANDMDVGLVIITFKGEGGLSQADLDILRTAGIESGYTLETLGMVAAPATAGEVRALADHPAIRSIWDNRPLRYYLHQATVMAGVDRMMVEPHLIVANGGLPVSGKGDFSVVINDSGIDGTHSDLQFPEHVIQNVQVLTDTATLAGFTPLVVVENVPNSDTHIGHGTHVAGIVGGTGQRSGGQYAGVAPGAKLIGTGSGAGLFILAALGGYEWSLANQFEYSIRVINNSYGSSGSFNPDDPLVVATRRAEERNIAVVFSAGNSGPGLDTLNVYCKAPWVICVAAGTKEGMLADFSSRGTPAYVRLGDGNPLNDHDLPTITAPGTGRFYAANAGTFTSDVVSVRSTSNVVANGGTADTEIPLAFVAFYTQISGTSMSSPFIAGVIALMLDADPTLTDEEITAILTETATPMPGYQAFEVGAGYVNARAAVNAVFNPDLPYGAVVARDFNLDINIEPAAPEEEFVINFQPAEPGPDSPNTYHFQIEAGIELLNVHISFGNTPVTAETGNIMGLQLYAPDGTTYSTGLTLPVLDPTNAAIRVENPVAGEWIAEVRGVRGINVAATGGSVTQPFGLAFPERVDGTIRRFNVATQDIPDLAGHPQEDVIRTMLFNRRMDIRADGRFHPDQQVTRMSLARTLALNTPLRQFLAQQPRFGDVAPESRVFAESVAADGSSLRNFDFQADGMMATDGIAFLPGATVDRLDVAVALVRGLGRDDEAGALAGSTVTVDGVPLVDNGEIPPALRGYVQIALDEGIQEAFPAQLIEVAPGQFEAVPGPRYEPAQVMTRAGLAVTLNNFIPVFEAGP